MNGAVAREDALPRDAHERLAIVDGQLMPPSAATISVTDEGLLRGDGAFEVVRLYEGRPFALDEHLVRLSRSAQALRLDYARDDVERDVATLVGAAGPVDAALRIVVTRGGRRICIIEELKSLPRSISLITVEYAPISVMRGIKSLSYAPNMLVRRIAADAGGDDALLVTPEEEVLEGPTSSFFYALDGALYTPPLTAGILDSITRRHLLTITDASERVTSRDDLHRIEEAFFASTLSEVHPVRAIDGQELDRAPGPCTVDAAERMGTHIADTLIP